MLPIMRRIITGGELVKQSLIAWYDFTDAADSQSLMDRSGMGNNGINGSTAEIDTNDVTFDGTRAILGGDDYIITPNIPQIAMKGDWALLLTGIFNSTIASTQYAGLSATPANDQYITMVYNGAGKVIITARNVGGTSSNNLTISASAIEMLALVSKGGLLTLYRLVDMSSVSLVNPLPTGTCRLGLGCLPRATVGGIVSAATFYYGLLYNKGLSIPELNKNKVFIKKALAQRGIVM